MNVTKWTVAHFSPTGGTKKVADAIAAGLDAPVSDLDLTRADCSADLSEGVGVIAVMPVYGGYVPRAALDRLNCLKAAGHPAAAVAVYGNREYDDALLQLSDKLTELGFNVVAAAAFIAEHSIVRSIATGRPDAEDKASCAEFGKALCKKLAADDMSPITVPGTRPYPDPKPAAIRPAANDTCVKCGTCVEACPVAAISAEDIAASDAGKCINCQRCIAVCPTGARTMPEDYLANVEKRLREIAGTPKKPVMFI